MYPVHHLVDVSFNTVFLCVSVLTGFTRTPAKLYSTCCTLKISAFIEERIILEFTAYVGCI